MRRILFLNICCVFLVMTSCTKDGADQTANKQVTTTQSVQTDKMDPESKRVVDNLTKKGFWYVEHWHKPVVGTKGADKAAYDANRARWYQFSDDGTFLHGQRKETIGKGTWSYEPSIAAIKMLADDKKYNAEFQVQMHSEGGVMSWTSTKRFNSETIMAYLEEYVELMDELP